MEKDYEAEAQKMIDQVRSERLKYAIADEAVAQAKAEKVDASKLATLLRQKDEVDAAVELATAEMVEAVLVKVKR